jgi:hypothetical protein
MNAAYVEVSHYLVDEESGPYYEIAYRINEDFGKSSPFHVRIQVL